MSLRRRLGFPGRQNLAGHKAPYACSVCCMRGHNYGNCDIRKRIDKINEALPPGEPWIPRWVKHFNHP